MLLYYSYDDFKRQGIRVGELDFLNFMGRRALSVRGYVPSCEINSQKFGDSLVDKIKPKELALACEFASIYLR